MSRSDVYTFLASALIVFVVCFVTSAPGIGLVDAGELTTAAYTLSIAHPTGYPLYTNLGHLWLMLTPFNPARGMVVFSVLMASLGAGFLSLFAVRILKSIEWLSPVLRNSIAVLLTIGIGLSPTVWTSVDFTEVYPLTWLIGCIILFVSYLTYSDTARKHPHLPLLICYLWGLGFGNHLTIMWFAPLVLLIAFRYISSSENRRLAAAFCVLLYLAGTSINLYLPIRSYRGPLLDWSAPHTLPGLYRHLTGWQYHVWMFKGNWLVFFRKLGTYLSSVPLDIGWALLILAVIGLLISLARKQWLVVSIFGVWLLGNLYNVNYDIPDISTYFLAFYAPLFIVAVYGFAYVIERLKIGVADRRLQIAIAVVLAVIVPVVSIAAAGSDGIQASNRFATVLATEVMNTLPQNALVAQGNWDLQSPYIYMHNVEHFRPDLIFLDLSLMQRPWYILQEQRHHPEIFAGVDKQVSDFIREVAPFESGKPYDGRRIENAYVALIDSILSKQLSKRPVYIRDTYLSGHGGVAAKMKMIPGGYFMRITDVPTQEPVINGDRIASAVVERDGRVNYLLHTVAQYSSDRGNYAMGLGDTLTVRQTLEICQKYGSDIEETQKYIKRPNNFSRGNPFLNESSSFLIGHRWHRHGQSCCSLKGSRIYSLRFRRQYL